MTQQKRPRQRRFLGRRKKNPDGTMTIIEHLKELRRRVIICICALCVATVVGFIWYQHSLFGLPTLGEIMRGPYCSLPSHMRVTFGPDEECRLLATRPFEMFMLRLKVGAIVGIVLASPVWLYQIWAFITPGLHKTEKRATFTFVTIAVFLFVAGAVLAYFVLSYGLEMLMGIGDEAQFAALTGQDYFNFFLALLIVFGVSFEVPLIIVMLNLVGVLRYEQLKDKRRYIVVGLFIFAAVMTPGQDPFSMVAMALSLCLLVEIALQICRVNDKRRGRERPEWLDLDDEEASALDTGPGGVDAAQPIAPARPVARPGGIGPKNAAHSWVAPEAGRSSAGGPAGSGGAGAGGVDYSDVL